MVNKTAILAELCASSSIMTQLFEDWIDVQSYSFWRFFRDEKSVREWEKFLRHVSEKYNCSNVFMYKSDVAGMVIVLDHCVVRTYRTAKFLKIRPLYRLRNPYLERCMMSKQMGHVGVFVCKKIKPLVNIADLTLSVKFTPERFEKLLNDVGKGLDKIHSYGYCHNDTSLDNTGYDEETGNFVIFDFDASFPTTQMRRAICMDRTKWEKSLELWSKFLPLH